MINYILATKALKVICIQFTDNAVLNLIDHLRDKGWSIQECDSEVYYNKEWCGGKVQVTFVDANTPLKF
jgi:hypothetical protein